MILEDMQWVDTETHVAMDALVEALPPYALVAATYRPEYVDRGAATRATPGARGRSAARHRRHAGRAKLGDTWALPLKRLVAEPAGKLALPQECDDPRGDGALAGERGTTVSRAPSSR
jgi:hypothetical protein